MTRFAVSLALGFLSWSGILPCNGSFLPEDVRTIPVTIVTDSSFRVASQWRGVAKSAIERGSKGLEDALGIRFDVVEELAFSPAPSHEGLADVLEDAVRSAGQRKGILVVFAGDRFSQQMSRPELGFSFMSRPAMILVASRSFHAKRSHDQTEHLAWLFRHELGHVFGVPHLGLGDIMEEQAERQTWAYSDISLDIMRANRLQEFSSRAPFLHSDLGTLRDAYFLLDGRGEIDATLLVNLGAALHREGRPAEATEAFGRALKRDASPAALLGLAQSHLAGGDTASARWVAEEASRSTLTAEERGVAGAVWLGLGDFERAETLLTEALAEIRDRFSLWFNRGLARFRRENYAASKEDFEQALAVEERPEGWFNLGLACDALQDREGVRRSFSRYLELVPEGPRAEDARRFLEVRGSP